MGKLPDEYSAHMVVARQSLEKVNFSYNLHLNRLELKGQRRDDHIAKTDYNRLDSSGIKLNLQQFLGPHFDIEKNKPLIHGKLFNETLNSYFYYDQEEILSNAIEPYKMYEDYKDLFPNHENYFIKALIEPPYGVDLGKELSACGEYVLDFLNYFFDDINKIDVFSWDTNCSIVFNPENEWWGNYFWTVYNPKKKWYIGIIASETD